MFKETKLIAGKEDAAYDQLKLSVERENRADVYKKAELPDDWHYKNTPRCAPIVVVAKKGYLLVKSKGQEGRIHGNKCNAALIQALIS